MEMENTWKTVENMTLKESIGHTWSSQQAHLGRKSSP